MSAATPPNAPAASASASTLSGIQAPAETLPTHILDQISNAGYYSKAKHPLPASVCDDGLPPVQANRRRLHVSMSVMDIKNIDPIKETFACKFRVYALWEEETLADFNLDHLAAKARAATGDFVSLNSAEIAEFEEKWGANLSKMLTVFNMVEIEACEEQSVRLYGGNPGCTAILWNQLYLMVARERFELANFPCDTQNLTLEIRLNDAASWDRFDLLVTGVQFRALALKTTEWAVLPPTVARDFPPHKGTNVRLRVKRYPRFYIINVAVIIFGLCLLGLLAFTMPLSAVGDRVNTVFTLILTSIAFKFVLAGMLPKVPYNTLLDQYVLTGMALLAINAFLTVVPLYIPPLTGSPAQVEPRIVNYICAGISGTLAIGTFTGWLLRLWRVTASASSSTDAAGFSPSMAQSIVSPPGKNWVAFRFYSLAHFLRTD